MSQCLGDLAISTKVDRDMSEFIDGEARDLGLTRAELLRRILEEYRESQREQLDCPHCSEAVVMDVRAYP